MAKAIVIVLIIGLGLSVAIAYAGVEPFATYKDAVSSKITTFISQYNFTTEPTYPYNIKFRGTYKASGAFGIEHTLSFKGNILTSQDSLFGTSTYEYTATMQSKTEGFIKATWITSGETSIMPFTYNKEANCIIMYPLGRDSTGLAYCK